MSNYFEQPVFQSLPKIKKHLSRICIFFCFILSSCSAGHDMASISSREERQKLKLYAEKPVWIQMMDDPNVNYYEAIKAFNIFWSKRQKPEEEENENGGEGKDSGEARKEKDAQEGKQYVVQFKSFKAWMGDMEPFVQPGGRILSLEERMAIWEKQKNSR